MFHLRAFTAFLFFALFPINALAGGLSVMPMRVNLDNNQHSAEITVSNSGSAPELLHVEAVSWEQVDGKDRYAPTQDLIVVPPLLRVDAGDEKIVRLALRGILSGTREHAFRIFLTEVPSKVNNHAVGAQIAVRLGVPVYANAGSLKTTQAAAGLTPSAQLTGMKRVHLNLVNTGDRHLVISAIRIYADASKNRLLAERSLNTALLAGTNHALDITANEMLTLPTLVVQGDGANGPFDLTVPVMQAASR